MTVLKAGKRLVDRCLWLEFVYGRIFNLKPKQLGKNAKLNSRSEGQNSHIEIFSQFLKTGVKSK